MKLFIWLSSNNINSGRLDVLVLVSLCVWPVERAKDKEGGLFSSLMRGRISALVMGKEEENKRARDVVDRTVPDRQ